MKKINKKKLILGIILGILIGTTLSITYSFFVYSRTGNNQQLITGNIWMNYKEKNEIILENVFPSSTYDENNYFEFSIEGTNTTTNKSIWYDVNLIRGDVPNGKLEANRLSDKDIKFTLTRQIGNGEIETLVNAKSYSDLSSALTMAVGEIEAGDSNVSHKFKLYAWISNDVVIYGGDPIDGGYEQSTWNNKFASFKINVTGDFNEKEAYKSADEKVLAAALNKSNTVASCENKTTWVDPEDNITYISGSKTCIDFNYLWYSGKMWRITAIYPDGAMKLVTDNNITSITFNESSEDFYTDENTTSYMYQWLNEDFYDTLYNASSFIDTTKKWDATMVEGDDISVKPAETIMVQANVGLLNSYEYYNSYRNLGSYYSGYLDIGYNWWLSNPYSLSSVRYVRNDGYDNCSAPPTYSYGARPSIYLKSDLSLTGSGTKLDPYKIVGDKEVGIENQNINTRISGEYVKIKYKDANQEDQLSPLYRIVGTEVSPLDNTETITKLVAMDYADNKATKKFATANSNGSGTIYGSGTTVDSEKTTWYSYLNGADTNGIHNNDGWFDSLEYNGVLTKGTYYMGNGDTASVHNYKGAICATSDITNKTKSCIKTSNTGSFNVGLLRYGEMFATQQGTGFKRSIIMWLITKCGTSGVRYVDTIGGSSDYYGPTSAYGSRPSIHLKSDVKILSGIGTELDPYVVS